MHFTVATFFLAAAHALPSFPSMESKAEVSEQLFNDLPDSASVIEALSNSEVYQKLSSSAQQSPLQPNELLNPTSKSCGISPVCPSYEGKIETINGRSYALYCINAPWGSYFWLPKAKTLSECEENCHRNNYDCNGLTFYPSTGACSIIYSKDAKPYIWDNGYQKIGAIPASKTDTAFGAGGLCPLPASDNQVWFFGDYRTNPYKMSCLNQFQVPESGKKQVGTVMNVDECGEKCTSETSCYGFHYYQPTFPGGNADGARSCELITEPVKSDMWTPVHKPYQYLAGLKIKGTSECGDQAWNRDNGCRNAEAE